MEFSADLCPMLAKVNLVVWSIAGSAWKCSVSDDINLHNSIFIKKIDSQYFVKWLNLFRCITALLCTQMPPKAHVIAIHNVRCHPPAPNTRDQDPFESCSRYYILVIDRQNRGLFLSLWEFAVHE